MSMSGICISMWHTIKGPSSLDLVQCLNLHLPEFRFIDSQCYFFRADILTISFPSLMQALSLLTIQILELSGTLVLLKYTAKPRYKFTNFFKKNNSWSYRNWFLSSALGFGFLALLIFLTSLLADYLYGSKVGVYIFSQLYHFICVEKKKNTNYMPSTVIVLALSLLLAYWNNINYMSSTFFQIPYCSIPILL